MCQNNTLSTFLSMLILHPIKLPPRYDWNTVEYGVNHHNPNPGDVQYQNQAWLYMWLGWSHHFKRLTVTTITATEYLCYKWPRICSTCRIHNPAYLWFINYNWNILDHGVKSIIHNTFNSPSFYTNSKTVMFIRIKTKCSTSSMSM